jgi:hypothetical protein
MKKVICLSFLVIVNIYAHENHHIPGAIPIAPNGGTIKEAKHEHIGSGEHDHIKAKKREIFFEAKIIENEIRVFPLELEPKQNKSFIAKNVKKFNKIEILVKDPRKKKKLNKKYIVRKDHWVIDIKGQRSHRFLIDISMLYQGAKYSSTLQVEKK